MKIEKQCISLELAQKLKELGVKQKSLFYWYENVNVPEYEKDLDNFYVEYTGTEKPTDNPKDYRGCQLIASAYTVAELGEMFGGVCVFSGYGLDGSTHKWFCTQMSMPEFEPWSEIWQEADTEADARGKMLIYLLENNLL